MWLNKLFSWWSAKTKYVLHLHCLYYYWFCYENGKENLFVVLFRRVQIQNKENADVQIHKHWTKIWVRSRIRIRHWINGKARIRFWFWITHFTLNSVLTIHFNWLWTCQSLSSYFATFGKVKSLLTTLLTWGKSKIKLTTKFCWEKLDVWAFLLCFFWMLRHPVFWFTSLFLTQSVRLPLVTYPSLCSTCVTYRISCHTIGHWVLSTQPLPREAEGFPRGERHFNHVPPLTYLIYLSPKEVCW